MNISALRHAGVVRAHHTASLQLVGFNPDEPREPDGKWGFGHVVEKTLKFANGDINSHVDAHGLHVQYGESRSGGLDHDTAWKLAGLLDGGGEGKFPRTDSVASYPDGDDQAAPTGFVQVTRPGPQEYRLELLNNDTTFDMSAAEAKQLAAVIKNHAGASRVDTGYGPLDVYVTDDHRIALHLEGHDGRPVDLQFDEHSWDRLRTALNVVYDGFDDGSDFGHDPSEDLDHVHVSTSAGELLVRRTGVPAGPDHSGKGILEITPADTSAWKIAFPADLAAVYDAFDAADAVAGFRGYVKDRCRPPISAASGPRRISLFDRSGGPGMRAPTRRRLILNHTDTRSGSYTNSRQPGRTGRWYSITNLAATNAAEIFVYDEIGFWGVTAADFAREIAALNVDTISLRINSPGGEVFDGIAIYNALRNHRAQVNVTVDGLAASIASVIAMAGDTVTMGRGSQMMIHDGLAVCVGNAADMLETATLLDKCSDNLASFYADRAGGTVADWRVLMRAETWYNAAEAVAAGLADKVAELPAPADDAKATNSWDLSVFRYPGREQAPAPVTAHAAGHVPAPDGDRGQDPASTGVDAVEPPPATPDDQAPEPEPESEPAVEPAGDAPADAASTVEPAGPAAALVDAFQGVRDAVTEPPAVPPPFDPDTFRAALAVIAQNAPAPAPAPAPPVAPQPAPVPEPAPEPPADVAPAAVLPIDGATIRAAARAAVAPPVVDPDLFRAAIRVVANDAPAPPAAQPPAPPGDGNPTPIDPIAFRRALREARL